MLILCRFNETQTLIFKFCNLAALDRSEDSYEWHIMFIYGCLPDIREMEPILLSGYSWEKRFREVE